MARRPTHSPYAAQASPQVTDPYYGDYSALAQQLAQSRTRPTFSIGQGIADATGDIVSAYFEKKAREKAEKSQQADISNMALAQQFAMKPNMTQQDANNMIGAPTPIDSQVFGQPAKPQERAASAVSMLNPRNAVKSGPDIADIARQFAPPQGFTGVLGENQRAFNNGQQVAAGPDKPMPVREPKTVETKQGVFTLNPDGTLGNRLGDSKGEAKTPSTKFAFDRELGKNRSVTSEEELAQPDRFAPPITAPSVKLFNRSGQEIGTGDPNDPSIQDRITSGEVRTAPPRQFSGEQSKAAGFANDALTSEENVAKLMNPTDPKAKKFDPTGNQGWSLTNYTSSPELQKYKQAKKNWGLAVLRQESGGAITEAEAEEYADAFFPKFGDKPEVVAQKKAQREEKVRGVISASGGAYEANFGNKKSSAPDGIDPSVWAHMTDEEKALWQK